MSGEGGARVRVRFVTTHDAFRITDAPFVLPQKLGRLGLSEVVNHLLSGTSSGDDAAASSRQPFDFSIQGVLLRTQLKTFLQKYRVNLEDIVTIEYQPALSLSEEAEVLETPAWVGCLSTTLSFGGSGGAAGGVIIAGCYDGTVQIARGGPKAAGSFTAHEGAHPVRALAAWRGAGSGGGGGAEAFLATGSKDLSVKLWSLSGTDAPIGRAGGGGKKDSGEAPPVQATQVAELVGHINSVESLDLWTTASGAGNSTESLLLSGDWAGNVFGWSVGLAGEWRDEQQESGQQQGGKKKMKTSQNAQGGSRATLREIKPAFTVRAHTQAVSSIVCLGSNSSSSSSSSSGGQERVLTASWDHSLKEWDMRTQDCVCTAVSNKVITSLAASPSSGGSAAVLTAHPDGKVRLWDLRSGSGSGSGSGDCRGVFASSTAQWVSSVAWHPTSANVFASADYAGIVRVWDTRSAAAPLGSSEAHDGKALCCAWAPAAGQEACKIVSGGSDCNLSAYSFE